MADNNKNPRRTIWLSETEPLSHYDIWLSKNQHLNSDGEPLSDSGVLRPCDYIFKVWDCDNWYPIIGFNSTAVNKINTVYNQNYQSTNPNTGHTINSNSYLEFHLPLFTKPECSPSELFDAGTIGDAILEYVTQEEWLAIFEGDAFSYAFKWYFKFIVNNGGININELLEPAEANKLGGIWADEFSIEDMFPDSEAHDSHSQTEINDSYNWIALAKYKYNHGTSDYNLYISAKDIVGAINHYQTENPDAPGIDIDIDNLVQELLDIFKNSSSLGFEDVWSVASDPHVYPHIWGVTPSNAGRFLRINPEWNDEGAGWSQSNNNMDWVDLREIIPDLINEGDILVPKDGINISYVLPHGDDIQYVEFGLNHIEEATDGAFCRKTTSNGYSDIEWTSLDDIYPLLTADSSSDIRYVVKGGGGRKEFLRSDGEWEVPEGTQYTEGPFIKIENGTIGIKANPANGSWYIRSDSGSLSWASVPEQQEYSVLSQNDHSTGPYVINGCGNVSSPEDLFLNGNGEWKNILSGGTEEYDAGDGIEILTPLLGNKIIKGNIKECDLNGYNSGFSADTSIEFRAPSGGSIIKNVVTLNIDGGNLNGGSTYDLLPYTYTKINLASNGTINFIIDGQTSYVNGNPIYVILSIPDKTYSTYTINIKDSLNNNSNDFISINNALVSDSSSIKFGCDVNKFLITMLFGIVKVEPLGYIEANRTEPEPEPEPSEP